MSDILTRAELADFFQPYAERAHMGSEMVHIHCAQPHELGDPANEWAHYCAGYICSVTDTSVTKYVSGTNSEKPIPFDTINRVTIHDLAGKLLREYRVLHAECVA